jgi:hypothetical protein
MTPKIDPYPLMKARKNHSPSTWRSDEIETFGYSKSDAHLMANDSSQNWKASGGGQRACPFSRHQYDPITNTLIIP